MTELQKCSNEPPEIFEIPELKEFYSFPFKPTRFGQKVFEPGRNEPCFCGSGIKYKKCHKAFDSVRYSQLIKTINSEANAIRRDTVCAN